MAVAEEQAVEAVEDLLSPLATIYERMAVILAELPAIGKTEYNEQQRFHYRGHDQVLNALNPLLGAYGVFVVPDVIERITGERTTGGGKTMYEVNLHVRFRFYGLAGDYVEASGWGEGTDMGDKSTNKAMTAAFKYVIAAVFAISTEEDQDADGATPEETTRTRGGAAPAPVKARPKAQEQPTDWKEIKQWIETGYGRQSWADFSEFVKLAQQQMFGHAAASQPEKAKIGAVTAAVVGRLYEMVPPGGATPPGRAPMQEAWNEQLDVVLEGPEWRMSADETDRPDAPTATPDEEPPGQSPDSGTP